MKTKSMSKIICVALATIAVPVLFFAKAGPRADDKSAATYKAKCATCHGADGKGDTPAGKSTKVRSFADPEVVKQSDDDLVGIIEKGKAKMPGYSKSMKPDEIKDMVAYIRALAK
jgi:cytochrome c6